MMENNNAEFDELGEWAEYDQQNPPIEPYYLRTIGCLGGLFLGMVIPGALFYLLVLLDRAYGEPFVIRRPETMRLLFLYPFSFWAGIAGLFAYPPLAERIRKSRGPGPKRRRMSRGRWLSIAVLAVVSIGAIGVFKFQSRRDKLKAVFVAVAQGKLKLDAQGSLVLPASLASTSCNGKAYVTRRGQLLMVFLPRQLIDGAFLGEPYAIEGRLICSRPLRKSDLLRDWSELGDKGVKINFPQPGPYPPRLGEVSLQRKLPGNDYYVSNRFFGSED